MTIPLGSVTLIKLLDGVGGLVRSIVAMATVTASNWPSTRPAETNPSPEFPMRFHLTVTCQLDV